MKLMKSAFLIIMCLGTVLYAKAQDQEYNLDETYSINKNGTIHLNSDDAEVDIKGADRSNVHLKVYRKVDVKGLTIDSEGEFRIEVKQQGDSLVIREVNTEDFSAVGVVNKVYRIIIEAPINAGLDMKGDDDTYNIDGLNGSIAIDADDTEIDLNNVSGNDFYFDMDDGTITMDKATGRLKLLMDDGDFEVGQAEFTKVDANYDDGSVTLTSPLAKNGKYHFDMDDGDLKFNIAGGGSKANIHHDDSDFEIGNSFKDISIQDNSTQLSLPGGDAQIRIKTDDGAIKLRTI